MGQALIIHMIGVIKLKFCVSQKGIFLDGNRLTGVKQIEFLSLGTGGNVIRLTMDVDSIDAEQTEDNRMMFDQKFQYIHADHVGVIAAQNITARQISAGEDE